MYKFIAVISTLFLVSCGIDSSDNVERGYIPRYGEVRYTVDATTEMCYSYIIAGNATSFTVVPCTEKVLEAVVRDMEQ